MKGKAPVSLSPVEDYFAKLGKSPTRATFKAFFYPVFPGAGRREEFGINCSDAAPLSGDEPFTAETLAEHHDWELFFVQAGQGILPPDERYALDLRFRADVGREEAKVILRAILTDLTEESVDGWYAIWERQQADAAAKVRRLPGMVVHCTGQGREAGDAIVAALDVIPDHARATLAQHWARLSEERGAPFPLVVALPPNPNDPARECGGPTPDGGTFSFEAAGLSPDLAQAAAGLMLAKAFLVATGQVTEWWGLGTQATQADDLARSWGVDVAAVRGAR